MKKIHIEFIPHNQQRYETSGDWFYDENGDLIIRVSEMDDWRYGFIIAVHELIEAGLCADRHISQREVDEFDLNYEGDGEPGDEPDAPYQREHNFATGIERLLSSELNIKWTDYDGEIGRLF